MLAQSELASDTPVTKTPHENPSMSKPLEVATASFQNSRSEAKETTIIFSENNGNALVLEMHRTNYPEREKIKAPKPREIAPPIKQYHRQARSDIDSDNGLSTRFLNTCSLKSIRSRMSSTAPRFRREKTSHYSATTDELPSNVATTKPTAMALMEVLNGVGRARMAARFGHYLSSQGFCMTKLRDAEMFGQTISKIYYSSGFENQATQVIEALPGNIAMEKNDNMTGNIRLVLGSDLLNFDLILEKGI
jgi:hypothetical protein